DVPVPATGGEGGEGGQGGQGGQGGEGSAARPADRVPISAPLGTRTVERVIPQGEAYPLPAWMVSGDERLPDGVHLDSGLLLLGGGQLVYAAPASGPLAPPAPVLAGSVRLPAEDFAAMRESITPGMTVYFH